MQISEVKKLTEKMFLVCEIIAFDLVALNTHLCRVRILVIENQYVKKHFRYY